MEFFGREEELLSLRGWLETAARRVTSQMLAVTGRHGAGKTRLLAEDFAAESRFGRPRGGSAAFCRPLSPRKAVRALREHRIDSAVQTSESARRSSPSPEPTDRADEARTRRAVAF